MYNCATYDQWCESREPENYKESSKLKAIRDYNEDDCVSTWLLAKWLREEQTSSGISYAGLNNDSEEPAFVYESNIKADKYMNINKYNIMSIQ